MIKYGIKLLDQNICIGSQRGVRGSQRESEGVRGSQRESEGVRGSQRESEGVRGESEGVGGSQRGARGSQRESEGVRGESEGSQSEPDWMRCDEYCVLLLASEYGSA